MKISWPERSWRRFRLKRVLLRSSTSPVISNARRALYRRRSSNGVPLSAKGSITVDGTSLTVNKVDGSTFELNIVPHTLEETITADYRSGSKVNLEVDVIARYLERLLLGDKAAHPATGGGITEAFLAEHGFMK